MVFHWSLSNRKSPQISWTLFSILTDLNNITVWMVSTCPLISKSSSPFNNPSVTVPRASVAIGINVTFMFHSFFNSLARLRYLSFFSFSFNFTLWSARTAKSIILRIIFLFSWLLKVWSSGKRLGDPFVCQNLIEVSASHSPGQMLGCAYTIWSYGQI